MPVPHATDILWFRLEIDICKSPSSIITIGHLLMNITSSQQAMELVGQITTEDGVGDIILECMYIRYVMAVDRIEYSVV